MSALLWVLAGIGGCTICFVALALIQCPICGAWFCPAAKHPWPPKVDDSEGT